ncbi:hypothetical protein [Klebsiella phage Kpn02]|uniref:Uncharacterized protein n=1 Tax=Klebsiella phage Kpn02 TaxID=3044023 RepID=A0AAT9V618_9CAUD|nr:hypothetical protein [Klebsiella phage Kpn02]
MHIAHIIWLDRVLVRCTSCSILVQYATHRTMLLKFGGPKKLFPLTTS